MNINVKVTITDLAGAVYREGERTITVHDGRTNVLPPHEFLAINNQERDRFIRAALAEAIEDAMRDQWQPKDRKRRKPHEYITPGDAGY